MSYLGTNYKLKSISPNILVSIENFYKIIVERSNPTFYDSLNQLSFNDSEIPISDMNNFIESAEKLLKNNKNGKTYTMIVFDIDNFREINSLYGYSTGNDILNHIAKILSSYIREPNLYCRVYDDNYALFLENYREIDIALLVIYLTEEISNYYIDLKTKLSFGICKTEPEDRNILSICSKAYFAKSTIKGKEHQLLANYDEVVELK